jgi:hypothetical protein
MQEIIQSSAMKRERADVPSLAGLNEKIAKSEREMTSFRPAAERECALQELIRLEKLRETHYGVPAPNRGKGVLPNAVHSRRKASVAAPK